MVKSNWVFCVQFKAGDTFIEMAEKYPVRLPSVCRSDGPLFEVMAYVLFNLTYCSGKYLTAVQICNILSMEGYQIDVDCLKSALRSREVRHAVRKVLGEGYEFQLDYTKESIIVGEFTKGYSMKVPMITVKDRCSGMQLMLGVGNVTVQLLAERMFGGPIIPKQQGGHSEVMKKSAENAPDCDVADDASSVSTFDPDWEPGSEDDGESLFDEELSDDDRKDGAGVLSNSNNSERLLETFRSKYYCSRKTITKLNRMNSNLEAENSSLRARLTADTTSTDNAEPVVHTLLEEHWRHSCFRR